MPANAKMTDLFVCKCKDHPPNPQAGLIILGSTDQKVESLGQARLLDLVVSFKGCLGFVVNGTMSTKTNSLPKARTGDVVIGLKVPSFSVGVIIIGAGSEDSG